MRGAFTVERTFKATPAQVFKAFTDERAKSRWFAGGGEGPTIVERSMDVRPGGREVAVGKWKSGVTSRFDAVYFDVVPDRRLVYAYEMHLDARKISVSLACVEIEPHPGRRQAQGQRAGGVPRRLRRQRLAASTAPTS